MSEYITVDIEHTDDPNCARLITNLNLAVDGAEHYTSKAEGEQGSPLAQTLFGIDGLHGLDIEARTLIVRREPDVEWPALIGEITDALKDFFL